MGYISGIPAECVLMTVRGKTKSNINKKGLKSKLRPFFVRMYGISIFRIISIHWYD